MIIMSYLRLTLYIKKNNYNLQFNTKIHNVYNTSKGGRQSVKLYEQNLI